MVRTSDAMSFTSLSPSRSWSWSFALSFLLRLYLKTHGPGVDRGLSVVTREGRAICLLICLYLRMVLTVNNYRPESLVPLGSNSADGVSSRIPNLV